MNEYHREADRLLIDGERAFERARLALHAAEDALRFTVRCDDVEDGRDYGDCVRCTSPTGFQEGEVQHWRCSRVQEALRMDAEDALADAVAEAGEAAEALKRFLEGAVT